LVALNIQRSFSGTRERSWFSWEHFTANEILLDVAASERDVRGNPREGRVEVDGNTMEDEAQAIIAILARAPLLTLDKITLGRDTPLYTNM